MKKMTIPARENHQVAFLATCIILVNDVIVIMIVVMIWTMILYCRNIAPHGIPELFACCSGYWNTPRLL